ARREAPGLRSKLRMHPAEPAGHQDPVIELAIAHRGALHELEQQPERPLGLIPDASVVVGRAKAGPRQQITIDPELAFAPALGPVLAPQRRAEILQEHPELVTTGEADRDDIRVIRGREAGGLALDTGDGGARPVKAAKDALQACLQCEVSRWK